mmetsp:Transcript_35534/g.95376  ORF Transcript_35534/g.95376 Transcript_35534/m.95376 type:complete len:241 (-) Transcript_35534:1372-2094(-)
MSGRDGPGRSGRGRGRGPPPSGGRGGARGRGRGPPPRGKSFNARDRSSSPPGSNNRSPNRSPPRGGGNEFGTAPKSRAYHSTGTSPPPSGPGGMNRKASTRRKTESEKVTVAIRIRPFKAEEQGQPAAFVVEPDAKAVLELNSETGGVDTMWNFDHVFDQHTSTRELYEDTGVTVVDRAMEGYNGTVFAYGGFWGIHPSMWSRRRNSAPPASPIECSSTLPSPLLLFLRQAKRRPERPSR